MSALKSEVTFYEKVPPIKLTEGRKCKLDTEGWGILTDYYLESFKMSQPKKGVVLSVATLRVGDRSGRITCVVKGSSTGLLFGMTSKQWTEVENLCHPQQQLFYRYFKNGLNKSFSYEEKIFYNFCLTNQRNDVLVARFRRCVNFRNQFKNEAFLHITDLRKCTDSLLDLYTEELRKQTADLKKNMDLGV